MNAPFWTEQELQTLRDNYPSIGIRCAELLGRPREGVKNKAQQLKLKREWPEGHPPKSKRNRSVVRSDAPRDGIPFVASIWQYAERVAA